MNQKLKLLSLFIGLFFLTACSNPPPLNGTAPTKDDALSNKIYKDEISIGRIDFIGYAPFIIADEKGFFKEKGLNVTIKKYDSLPLLSEDYKAGKITGRVNLTMAAVSEALDGISHRIVLVQNYSNGADVIIADKDIKGMNDLKDKKVGYPKGFLEEFTLEKLFKAYDMSLKDVNSVDGDLEALVNKITNKEIDAMILYEPFLSPLLEKYPDLHIIWSSGNFPGLITDVLTFRDDFINKYPETIKAIIDAYFEGVEFLKENPEESNKILAKYFNQSPEEVGKNLQKVLILDKLDNRSAFNRNDNIQSINEYVKELYKFLKNTEPDQNFLNNLIDPRFIQ